MKQCFLAFRPLILELPALTRQTILVPKQKSHLQLPRSGSPVRGEADVNGFKVLTTTTTTRLYQRISTNVNTLRKNISHINTVNIKKAPRVSSGLKTKESGNCKEADSILQLILRRTQSTPHLHRPDQRPSYPARAS